MKKLLLILLYVPLIGLGQNKDFFNNVKNLVFMHELSFASDDTCHAFYNNQPYNGLGILFSKGYQLLLIQRFHDGELDAYIEYYNNGRKKELMHGSCFSEYSLLKQWNEEGVLILHVTEFTSTEFYDNGMKKRYGDQSSSNQCWDKKGNDIDCKLLK